MRVLAAGSARLPRALRDVPRDHQGGRARRRFARRAGAAARADGGQIREQLPRRGRPGGFGASGPDGREGERSGRRGSRRRHVRVRVRLPAGGTLDRAGGGQRARRERKHGGGDRDVRASAGERRRVEARAGRGRARHLRRGARRVPSGAGVRQHGARHVRSGGGERAPADALGRVARARRGFRRARESVPRVGALVGGWAPRDRRHGERRARDRIAAGGGG